MSRCMRLVMAVVAVGAASAAGSSLEVTVSTDKATYLRWEPITINVTLYNPTDETIHLWWSNSCTSGYVMDDRYHVPDPFAYCPQVIVEVDVDPGETITFAFDHDWAAYAPEVGTHTVYGHSFGWFTEPVTFEVVAAPPDPGDVLIDFETVPGGAPLGEAPLSTAYAAWGVSFTSVREVHVATWDGVNHYATVSTTTYPPGFHIIAALDTPAYAASADVGTATGRTVTMLAKDADGEVIAAAESPPSVHPQLRGPLTVRATRPIHRLEWWPSEPSATVMLDNLLIAREHRAAGDADLNGTVDLDDFARLRHNFGMRHGATWAHGDFDGDGDVDLDDFALLKTHFGDQP